MQLAKAPPSLQQPIQSHFSQFSVPQTQVANSSSHHLQVINHPQQSQQIVFQPPTTSHVVPNHLRTPAPTHIIGPPFVDQSQFLTAIPVQPVFSATATVISPSHSAPEYVHTNVVLAQNQNQIQNHLQRKHEELQKQIVQQQDELRRVSEQLFMARYGIVPSIVNVSIPFPAPMDQTEGGERSRVSSSHVSHHSYHESHPQMLLHSSQNQNNPQIHVHQPSQTLPVIHQQHPPNVPLLYELNPPKPDPSEQSIQADRESEDIMQYMQHQAQSQAIPQQQIISNDDFELMPFQMSNTQAQILFSSGNANDGPNNPSSNKWAKSIFYLQKRPNCQSGIKMFTDFFT